MMFSTGKYTPLKAKSLHGFLCKSNIKLQICKYLIPIRESVFWVESFALQEIKKMNASFSYKI